MHITFTPSAQSALKPHLADGTRQLKLLYDTEGCGCVVSGVPALQLIEAGGPDDALGTGDPFDFWYEPRFEVFFEPRLRIDYDENQHAYSLKSDGQIYTTNLRLLLS
ncbi:iron-sulfur cluster biosynthesis family protein [Paenibacillus xylaniclasticus]|uniref:iron-sulfur cluster biosynthesis family protein n=1 Tax=Paenibacillus xylaniclasticus TaxID=588083 RepID=UPI000FD883D3|nr:MULTISPECIES: iron-sulfur cluster biosynthesis family protein [Paenibacillus]GFN30780.1 hypothetical protein PCURB6_10400 [Paenibacillus curdlanolyticus]